MSCRRWSISGRVQGVWFRESTRRQAEPLGLTGHAINRADGSVEVLACGEDDCLDALERWLATGPRLAEVKAVRRLDPPLNSECPASFTTG